MKRLLPAILLAIASLTGEPTARAQATGSVSEVSDLYYRGFVLNNEATRLEKAGDLPLASARFREASAIFDNIEKNYPTYEVEMRTNRQRNIQTALARIESGMMKQAAKDATAAEATAPAQTPASPPPANVMPQNQAPVAPNLPSGAGTGQVPALGDWLKQWEDMNKQKILQLEADNSQMQLDLSKWGTWHDWASGEITRVTQEKATLSKKSVALEQAVLSMQTEVEAGRAAKDQLDGLMKQRAELDLQLQQNAKKLTAAEQAEKAANEKLATATTSLNSMQQERDKLSTEREKLLKERDEAMKSRDTSAKERDAATASVLGMKIEMEDIRKKTGSGEMKKLIAENDRLRKELGEAQKQVATLQADSTRKDQEIATLRGQLTTLQGQLTTLRQESATFQTQVADLTRQLKELKEMPAGSEPNALITEENEMLRNIIMRQLRMQNRQQTAKELVIAELSKMENASEDLIKQVEVLKSARMTLSPDEEKLFKDPAAKELIGSNGVQVTLIAASAKPDAAGTAAATAKPAPGSVNALLVRANEAYSNRDFSAAAKAYEDALRAEPKNITALIGLGVTHQREAKYAESEAALQKVLAFEPDNDSASYAIAVTYFKQERWKESMTSFEKSLAKNTQNASARHYLGIISTKLSLVDRAEREFKTTLAIDPNYADAHFNLAVLYATWDPPQWDKARAEYDAAIKKGVKPDPALEKLLVDGKKVSQN